ncbi:class I SAM-dependent DNA methyltransferase [Hansschlegelia plantiphila]|uniref:class I SAM-dependent DNA methyltransferase n=1 Tax=Hansschlegelia plantiphila TaxID=374655 RepID=UPI002852B4C5|nr:DNA methyltransferase [Hansschlegelia plantiphila]
MAGARAMVEQAIEAFIARWQGRVGGQERANYALFLSELTDALGVPRPEPASAQAEDNDYVFERIVREPGRDGGAAHRRIDLYRRSCFVLEAKQSRQHGGAKDLFEATGVPEPVARGRRGAERAWDVLMLNARRQAEDYVRLLPQGHEPPPFVVVCDVGHCLELYANFRKDGKAYDQFPDRTGFRIYLEDLRRDDVRDRLVRLWTDPLSLDPALKAARVTRGIAERLAHVTRRLEGQGREPQEVAQFLMRVIFTMFAEDVELIPRDSFKTLLRHCAAAPERFAPTLGQVWEAMDQGGYAIGLNAQVRRFNGSFFKDRAVIPLDREEIGELLAAAAHDWRDVEPAIFGALLEQALDPDERRRLGAHYTPRAYVERLVVATVMEPLREDWAAALATAERQRKEGRAAAAIKTVRTFHDRLCAVRILDPACGTANFLYVSLELLKRLEGEVLEALADLGGQEALAGLEGHTVDPGQFLGLELNRRAAAIADLVLWIGYLQWHARTRRGGAPSEPILRAFGNIVACDAVLASPPGGPQRPEWPQADFIVGNPPFIGGKDLRGRLGETYAEALWTAHPHMNESADYVMYWWDRAAELLTRKGARLRRFGLVTTNSISQVFQRRAVERRLGASAPVSIVMAIPDHPWTKASRDHAAVRIAMTVVEAGSKDGALREVAAEHGLETDAPVVELRETVGRINADLTVGANLANAKSLLANEGLSSRGVSLHGAGFIVTPFQAKALGLGRRAGLDAHIRPYLNGRDLTGRARGVMAIDLFGLTAAQARARFPEAYQHLMTTVKPERDANNRHSYRLNWWLFGEPRSGLRPALEGLRRYIATVETAKHRVFQFLDGAILPDNMLVAIASDDAFHLGVLSSRTHGAWAAHAGATLEDRPRYSKSRCFDPFPFPDASQRERAEIRAVAEELDEHRQRVLSEHSELTLTQLYNVLEKLRAGVRATDLPPPERHVYEAGLVAILGELHERIDRVVAGAYGWRADLSDEAMIARLVALNQKRAAEEARGEIRFLRPAYQAGRSDRPDRQRDLEAGRQIEAGLSASFAPSKPAFPKDEVAQTATIMLALLEGGAPVDASGLAARFREGRRAERRIAATLDALARLGAVATTREAAGFSLRRP